MVVGGSVVFLYRFLLDQLGAEQLGLWSVVVSTTSLTGIVNLGLGGSLVKFVAQYIAQEKYSEIGLLIETTFLSLAIILGVGLLFLYLIINWLLSKLVPVTELQIALKLVPWTMSALWLSTMGQTFQATLDGYQRIDIRSIFLIVNNLLYLFACFVLVQSFGIMGLGYAFFLRGVLSLLVSRILIARMVPNLAWFPRHWSYKIFKETLAYGVNFQIISVLVLMLDPMTKGLLTYFGGLSATGYYEMAYRMIIQFREILIAANSVVTPIVAELHEKSASQIKYLYETSFKLVLFISLPFYTLIAIMTPIISRLWIGHYEPAFQVFATILAVSYAVNTLSAPAYFANLGTGRLSGNVSSHLIMATLNLVLGYLLGSIWSSYGVVLGVGIGLIVGSVYLIFSFSIKEKVPFQRLVSKGDIALFVSNLLVIAIASSHYLTSITSNASVIFNIGVLSCLFVFITGLFIWRHSMRPQIQSMIVFAFSNRLI